MAIQHERTVQRIECYPDGSVMVVYFDIFDDPDDDLLPTTSHKSVHIQAHADVTSHMQFVQDVCAGAWTNIAEAEEAAPDEV